MFQQVCSTITLVDAITTTKTNSAFHSHVLGSIKNKQIAGTKSDRGRSLCSQLAAMLTPRRAPTIVHDGAGPNGEKTDDLPSEFQ